jgi:single-strand DNA-binding protein
VNCVTLVGNLASEVELRELAESRKMASFLLAVDRESADGGADFVRIVCWNRQAETCAEYLARGNQVAIDGRLRSRSWQDPEGKRRSALEVVADRVQFLSRPQRAEQGATKKEKEKESVPVA